MAERAERINPHLAFSTRLHEDGRGLILEIPGFLSSGMGAAALTSSHVGSIKAALRKCGYNVNPAVSKVVLKDPKRIAISITNKDSKRMGFFNKVEVHKCVASYLDKTKHPGKFRLFED